MNKKKIINDLFSNYQMRKHSLVKIRWELDNLEDLVLKESKADYRTFMETQGGGKDSRDLLKEKKKLEYRLHLRDLLFEKLNEEQREIVLLKFERKMSPRKICETIFISESTYYRRMKAIYEKLLTFIDQFEGLFYI